MQPWVIVLLVVIAVLIAALVALAILGRKLQKKQEANNAQLEAAKQVMSVRFGVECGEPRSPFLPVEKNKKVISIANKIDNVVKEYVYGK